MVNLRYHLVSITAVFLALGVGVLFGSTVVDQGTVSFLEDRLGEVERDVAATQGRNSELKGRIDELERRESSLDEEASGRLIPGLLQGVPVVLVRLSGDDDADADLRTTLADADAVVDAVVTLGDDLALSDEGQRTRFVEALGLRPSLADQPARLRQVAARRLSAALWWPTHPLTGREGVDPAALAAADLAALAQAGFVTVDRPAGAPAGSPLPAGPEVGLVMISTPDRGLANGEALLFDVLRSVESVQPSPVTVVVTPDDGEEGPVATLREEDSSVSGVATVDHVASFAGRLALVLAVAEGVSTPSGHYGSGRGAQRLIPAPAG